MSVVIFYDRSPYSLTSGQLSKTYCYSSGLRIASLRPPLSGRSYYSEDAYTISYEPCPDPYEVASDTSAPDSSDEAHESWQAAYNASQAIGERPITVPWTTARSWTAHGTSFGAAADISGLLQEHGVGVYTIYVWGPIDGEDVPISQYSIFHGVTPPDTYSR